jgi:hypothetical protein
MTTALTNIYCIQLTFMSFVMSPHFKDPSTRVAMSFDAVFLQEFHLKKNYFAARTLGEEITFNLLKLRRILVSH